jgi:hypothetical protein
LRRAAQTPAAILTRQTAMRINLEPGTSVDSVANKLERFAGPG